MADDDQDTGQDTSTPAADASSPPPDTGALDTTSGELTPAKLDEYLSSVNEAMMGNREKFGLPRGDEGQGALPTDQVAGNIPSRPAGGGGDQPNQNPFPTNPSTPFGRRGPNTPLPIQNYGPGGTMYPSRTGALPTQPNMQVAANDVPQQAQAQAQQPSPFMQDAVAGGRLMVGSGLLGKAPLKAGDEAWRKFHANPGPQSLAKGGAVLPVHMAGGGDPSDPDSYQGDYYNPTPTQDTADTAPTTPSLSPGANPDYVPDDTQMQNSVQQYLSQKGAPQEMVQSELAKYKDIEDPATKWLSVLGNVQDPNKRADFINAGRADQEDLFHKSRLALTQDAEGNADKIAKNLEAGLAKVPTGETVRVRTDPDGNYQFDVRYANPGQDPTKAPQTYTLTPAQVHDLTNLAKGGQFDALYERKIGPTLAALAQMPGTAIPEKKKDDKSEPPAPEFNKNDIYGGRYTSQELKLAEMYPNYQQKIQFLESMRKEREDRASEEKQAEGKSAALDRRAEIAAGARVAGSKEATHRQELRDQAANDREIQRLQASRMTAIEHAIVSNAASIRGTNQPLPANVQAQLDSITASRGTAAGGSPIPGSEDTGVAPTAARPGQAQPAAVPAGRAQAPTGTNPQGAAKVGMLPKSSITVGGKQWVRPQAPQQ